MFDALEAFGKSHPVWGVCAGAIIIAKEVQNPTQRSLGLIDIRATRNFYGSQLDSFSAKVRITPLGIDTAVDFIRAPLLAPLSPAVEVLASHDGHAVLLKQGNIMASSFHIELGRETALHRYFLGL
jgi:pyridoxal 5'-phosphate synthase pdxT subunit